MRRVFLFSALLIAGMAASQLLPGWLGPGGAGGATSAKLVIQLVTMICLGFIMIHVGYEFDVDRSRLRSYATDYGVAATAAAFPWLFCAGYFVVVLMPAGAWHDFEAWKQALLAGRFAAPTSAGILFAMLAAAGLSATWVFKKARVLAIFDDLDTVLLMIPLKALLVGLKWQLLAVVAVMVLLLWVGWRWLHRIRLPITWPWVLGYAVVLALVSEGIYAGSKLLDDTVPIHIEILLPAFVLGCVLARPAGQDPHQDDAREGHQEGPESPSEQRVATLLSGLFMVLVGLSMPSITASAAAADLTLAALAGHTLWLTLLANLGKMYPLFCYRSEVSWRQRLALSIGMWPRGEVGAGVLVLSLAYGIGGAMVSVATLCLALNLLLTGVFIWIVKRLIHLDQRDPVATQRP